MERKTLICALLGLIACASTSPAPRGNHSSDDRINQSAESAEPSAPVSRREVEPQAGPDGRESTDEPAPPEPAAPSVPSRTALPALPSSDRGGPGRPGAVSAAGPRAAPVVRFQISLSGEVRAAPVAWSGGLVIATRNGRLLCLDPASGQERWEVRTQAVRGSGLAIAGGTVFVAEISRRGLVHAVDLATGERRWARDVGPTSTSLAVAGDLLLVANDRLGGIAALDVAAGQERWRVELGDRRGAPVVTETAVLVGDGEEVVALSPAGGERLWRARLAGPVAAISALGQRAAVTLESGGVAVLDPSDGQVLWQRDGLSTPVGQPAHDGRRVYLVAGEALLALDAGDGTELWRAEAANGTSPTVASDTIYLPAAPDRIAALDTEEGRQLWERTFDRPLGTLPVAAHGAVFLPLRVDLEGRASLVALEEPGG